MRESRFSEEQIIRLLREGEPAEKKGDICQRHRISAQASSRWNAKTVVWGANTHWNSVLQVGAHHLARCFVREGWRVAYLGAPLMPLSFLNRGRKRETSLQFSTWLRGGQWDLNGRLFYYTPFTLLANRNRPLLRSPWLLDNWHRFTLPHLGKTLKKHGFDRPELLVVDHPLHTPLVDIVSAEQMLVRITDNLESYGSVSQAMVRKESELIQRADAVVYTSRKLGERIASCSPRLSSYLPNGVSASLFSRTVPEPDDIAGIARPRCIYVGALDERVDYGLLSFCAQRLPSVSFVLIGPSAGSIPGISTIPNMHYLGFKPHAQVPAYLGASDIALLPYDVLRHPEWIHAASSIKLLEYLAAGLPVVANEYHEIKDMGDLVSLARDKHSFCNILETLVATPPSDAMRQSLMEHAKSNDWMSRYKELQALLRKA